MLGRIIKGLIQGLPWPHARFHLQDIEEPHWIEESWKEVSPVRLHAFLPPEISVRGIGIEEKRRIEKGLGVGIKTDLWEFLNGFIIIPLGETLENGCLCQETKPVPVFASEEGGP